MLQNSILLEKDMCTTESEDDDNDQDVEKLFNFLRREVNARVYDKLLKRMAMKDPSIIKDLFHDEKLDEIREILDRR
jgi:hypothetical protein